MIKTLKEMPRAVKIEIDLTGPEGNAFYLLGLARSLCENFDLDAGVVRKEMMAGDYDELLEVFDNYFGEIVNLYR
jgi:hypothetical protein